MTLQTPEEVKRYLIDRRWVAEDDELRIEPLSGGVSNQVWMIAGGGFRWVMKQALPKLKVAAEWYSDVRRIERESAAMAAYARLLDEGAVPQLLHADQDAHTYVMTCAPEDAVPWKQELMQGRFDPETAALAGRLLGAMHGRSAGQSRELKEAFGDLTFVEELRIDPFHLHLMLRFPELRDSIAAIIAELTGERSCLVHGDYSPKNMLIDADRRLIVLDFEVAHWGNPLFDVAFCSAHLLLKGWALSKPEEACGLVDAFLRGYGRDACGLLPHLGIMLLARIDGKSPVEYVKDEKIKAEIRKTGMEWTALALSEQRRRWSAEGLMNEIRRVMEGQRG